MRLIKQQVEEFKDKKLTKANKHILGVTNSSKRDELLFTRFKNADEYEKGADDLASKIVHNSNPTSKDSVVGFISETYYIKYDKDNNELVMYIPNDAMESGNQLVSYFKPSRGIDYYNHLLNNYYVSEI